MISIKHVKRLELILLFSFIPIIVQVIPYLFIGNAYPLLLAMVLASPFFYFVKKKKNLPKAIKYWSLLIICYGTVRLLLHLLCYIEPKGIPSGVYYQFTFWYAIKSIFYVLLGSCLFVKRRQIKTLV